VNLKTVAAWSRALAEETATNGDGRFSLEAAPGTCSLQGAAPGYAEARVDGIEVAAGEVLTEVRVALEPAGKCRLQVLDRQGHALAKARAFVLDSQGGLVRPDPSRESSFDGTILLSGLRPGSYQAVVVHPAWAPARAPLEATLSGSRAVVRLEEGGGLSIAITDRLGAAVEGAEVAIRDEHGIDFLDLALAGGAVLGGAPPARSDREGRLPSLRLPAGHYRIAVDPRAPPEGRRPLEQPVEVTAGREETLRIVIGDDGPQDADGTRGN
jgi:hypothetical protein